MSWLWVVIAAIVLILIAALANDIYNNARDIERGIEPEPPAR